MAGKNPYRLWELKPVRLPDPKAETPYRARCTLKQSNPTFPCELDLEKPFRLASRKTSDCPSWITYLDCTDNRSRVTRDTPDKRLTRIKRNETKTCWPPENIRVNLEPTRKNRRFNNKIKCGVAVHLQNFAFVLTPLHRAFHCLFGVVHFFFSKFRSAPRASSLHLEISKKKKFISQNPLQKSNCVIFISFYFMKIFKTISTFSKWFTHP